MKENYLEKLEDIYICLSEIKDQMNIIIQDYLLEDVKDIPLADLQLYYTSIKFHLNILFRVLAFEHKGLKEFIEQI